MPVLYSVRIELHMYKYRNDDDAVNLEWWWGGALLCHVRVWSPGLRT